MAPAVIVEDFAARGELGWFFETMLVWYGWAERILVSLKIPEFGDQRYRCSQCVVKNGSVENLPRTFECGGSLNRELAARGIYAACFGLAGPWKSVCCATSR
eukprot:618319-Amphidinium_carterae.1